MPIDPVDNDLLDQLKIILRRDLRLGADATIAHDMPLVGGPTDLDSIDILLLVSSLEKQFQIKVPNEAIGRSAFATVGTLARYVQDNRETLRVATIASRTTAPTDPLALLPHGPEFRFVSVVRELVPGTSAVGLWNVRGDEWFVAGHFPGRPIVPGVLIGEALAQVAGIATAEPGERGGVLAHLDLRFLAPVAPPASIELRATLARRQDRSRQCDVIASVGGQAVARGTLILSGD